MMNLDLIVEGLKEQLTSGDNLSIMSSKAGADDKSVESVLGLGLPLLLGAMSNKASEPEGSQTIMNIVSKMSNNNPMDNMTGYMNDPEQFQGSNMLSSILGSNLQPIQQLVSKSTGLPPSAVGQILAMALPLVMGSLSKSVQTQNIKPEGLPGLLQEQSRMAASASPEAAEMMNQVFVSKQTSGGLMGLVKRLLGG
jgi:hypothetical protein